MAARGVQAIKKEEGIALLFNMDIVQLYEKWTSINIIDIIDDSIEQSTQSITDRQREQLFAGKTSLGNDISPFYTPATVQFKIEKRQPADRVTLRDTGSFYAGMKTKSIGRGEIYIDSSDEKTEELTIKYRDIWGLSPELLNDYVQELKPIISSRLESLTGLKLE